MPSHGDFGWAVKHHAPIRSWPKIASHAGWIKVIKITRSGRCIAYIIPNPVPPKQEN